MVRHQVHGVPCSGERDITQATLLRMRIPPGSARTAFKSRSSLTSEGEPHWLAFTANDYSMIRIQASCSMDSL
jgi:hypothetical protein